MRIVDLKGLWDYLVAHPGMSQRELMKRSGYKSSDGDIILLKMEAAGYYISQRDDGKIFAFRKNVEGEKDEWEVRCKWFDQPQGIRGDEGDREGGDTNSNHRCPHCLHRWDCDSGSELRDPGAGSIGINSNGNPFLPLGKKMK